MPCGHRERRICLCQTKERYILSIYGLKGSILSAQRVTMNLHFTYFDLLLDFCCACSDTQQLEEIPVIQFAQFVNDKELPMPLLKEQFLTPPHHSPSRSLSHDKNNTNHNVCICFEHVFHPYICAFIFVIRLSLCVKAHH